MNSTKATHLELVTRREAARRCGLGLRQIKAAVENGELPLYRIGGWPRLRWNDVLAWLENHRERRQVRGSRASRESVDAETR